MLTQVLEMLANMFLQILALFDRVIGGLDAWDLVLGALIVTTIHRMLLVPILGGGAVSLGDKIGDDISAARKNISKRSVENQGVKE